MTRQEANKEILRILHDAPVEENLRKVDCALSSEEFNISYDIIKYYIESYPDIRWCQLMWNLDCYLKNKEDRFHEESIETLKKLKQ